LNLDQERANEGALRKRPEAAAVLLALEMKLSPKEICLLGSSLPPMDLLPFRHYCSQSNCELSLAFYVKHAAKGFGGYTRFTGRERWLLKLLTLASAQTHRPI
jgi:hypothetical protein